MKINLHQVDAFTNQIFGGNPAGVVTNADDLTDEQMIQIAREMNLSETAFVCKPTTEAADAKIRYITREGVEIDFCGHATVGTLYELARLKLFGLGKSGQNDIRIETGAGILEMSVINDPGSEPRIRFVAPPVRMEQYRLQGAAFAKAFDMPVDALLPDGQVCIDRHLNYIYIPIASLKALSGLQFNLDSIRKAFAAENIIVFCLFTNETISADAQLHTRVTCPLIGIDEDPFTGSMQAGLLYAARRNQLIDDKLQAITTEQGSSMGRPGSADITEAETGEIAVTASAAQVFSTTLEL
jgi:PhzF family phenazine biosynthesis protein